MKIFTGYQWDTISGAVIGILVGLLLLVGGTCRAWKVKKKTRRETARAGQPPQFTSSQRQWYEQEKPYEVEKIESCGLRESGGQSIYELNKSMRQPCVYSGREGTYLWFHQVQFSGRGIGCASTMDSGNVSWLGLEIHQ